MGDYLSKRLKKDGFASVKFKLVDEITYYATEADYAEQARQQEINDAKAESNYEADWNNYYLTEPGGAPPQKENYVPKQAKLKKTGEEHHYYMLVSGGLYSKASGKVVNSITDIKITGVLVGVFTVALGAFGFAFPFIFPPNKTVPVIGFGFANPIMSLVVFALIGLITGFAIGFIINSFRHLRDVKNKAKRIVSIAVVTIFLAGLLTGGVLFYKLFPFKTIELEGVTYQKSGDGKTYDVLPFEGDVEEVTIYDTVRGKKVNGINFDEHPSVKTVTFHGSRLRDFFSENTTLEKVIVADEIEEIESSAFEDCTALKEVVLPESVERIRLSAFQDCTSLEKVNLSDSLTYVAEYAFSGCAGIEELYLGASLAGIHETSFSGLSGIKKITCNRDNGFNLSIFDTPPVNEVELVIGPNVKKANRFGLSLLCGHITKVTFTEDCQIKELHGTFSGYSRLKSIVLPDTVDTIGDYTFRECKLFTKFDLSRMSKVETASLFSGDIALEEVILPETGVTSFGRYMFLRCESLKSVNYPKSLKTIETFAFVDCGLTEYVLPDNVEEIQYAAFADTSGNYYIPSSVTTMGAEAFRGSSGTVYCEASSQPSSWDANWLEGSNVEVVWSYQGVEFE